MPASPSPAHVLPPPIVALASWLLPGLGYVLIGQQKRGMTVGVAILLLLLLGLFIGGVRVMTVPGYAEDGRRVLVNRHGQRDPDAGADGRWVMKVAPMSELRDKPWSIAQVLTGPAALGGMGWSVWASDPANGPGGVEAPAAPSHARVNEIGVLYTAVAGMLNLLAIIDAASRAEHLRSQRMAGT